jgi:uncharacterized membrane protein required for colicin V production
MTPNVYLDIGGLGILGISLFIGKIRGFTREVLEILVWGGALLCTLYGHSFLEPFLSPSTSRWCLFLSTLILLKITSRSFLHYFPLPHFSSLGILVGGLRGVLLLTSLYFLFLSFPLSSPQLKNLQTSVLSSAIREGFLKMSSFYQKKGVITDLREMVLFRKDQWKSLEQQEQIPFPSPVSTSPSPFLSPEKRMTETVPFVPTSAEEL